MKYFIKLTSRVINKLHIVDIQKIDNTYYINMNNNHIRGSMLFSFGAVSSTNDSIIIFEKTNKKDYDIITKFIEDIDTNTNTDTNN